MTLSQAEHLVLKISATFANSKFDSVKKQAYAEALEKLDQATTAQAINKLTLTNKFCPTVAEIYEVYLSIKKSQGRYTPTLKEPKEPCPVCHGLGFLIKLHTVNMLPYEYLFHCECPVGAKWSYDGRIISENRSDYRIPSISEYHRNEQQVSA